MVVILSTPQIIQRTIEFFRTAQPLLDTKPGSVARDLMIDSFSIRMSELYDELNRVSSAQSIARSLGTDLDNWSSNFGESRLNPGRSIGPAILTFSSIDADTSLPSGSLVYSKNGTSFRLISTTNVLASDESKYRAIATRIRADLDNIGITDEYAVEVLVECSITGTKGNISKYSLISTTIAYISNVTNVVPFSGGSPAENDTAYRNRIISIFSGSNTGTELGYANVVGQDPAVLDTVVVGPGDPLMIRDNSVQQVDDYGNLVLDADGDPVIISEGDGGKVDIYVYGSRFTESTDTYIYNDASGQNDPTNSDNDYELGQISGYENASLNKKRLKLLKNRILPSQPIVNIVEVSGSRSGSFSAQIIDTYGVSSGNYTLTKDTGNYAGSSFGFDKLSWVSDYSTVTGEDITKASFNGQDQFAYTDLLTISNIRRTVTVTNENSNVGSTDRSEIYLNHVPIRNIIKVLNKTTGERYVVSDRNPDGSTGALNTTGRIIVSGSSLPAVSDTLQVDYEWIFYHDTYVDFDSKVTNDNIRTATDSVDWGYNNAIRREQAIVSIISGVPSITVSLPISSIVSVNKTDIDFNKTLTSGSTGGIQAVVTNSVSNVVSITNTSNNAELYATYKKNGYFEGSTIVLPTDTSGNAGDNVDIYYNAIDVFVANNTAGSFSETKITLSPEAITEFGLAAGDIVEVNYIANINELLPSVDLNTLPVVKNVNKFSTTTQTGIGYQPISNVYSGSIPTKNLRKSPTRLAVNFTGTNSPGVLTIRGTTYRLIDGVVFSAPLNGLKQDLSQAIRTGLGLNDDATIPSTVSVARLVSLEKVEVASANSTIVTDSLNNYDIIGYSINNASFALDDAIYETTLTVKETRLPSTEDNVLNSILAGDKLRISFYIATTDDSENISVSTNGVQYTENSFGFVDIMSISSGFQTNGIVSGSINMISTNQPAVGSRYKVGYLYTSPKPGERINIRYNYNSLINDSTLRLEGQRQIIGDVMIKESPYILVNLSASIIVSSGYTNSQTIVAQNVGDKLSNTINGLDLGATLHPSDLVNASYQITGLDAITILGFNINGSSGQVSKIQAQKNQYMRANQVTITITTS